MNRNNYYILVDLVINNGFYPSFDNLKKLNEGASFYYTLLKYVRSYEPIIDYIIKCDINNIINNKPKNITKNIGTLKTLLLIKKYCSIIYHFVL